MKTLTLSFLLLILLFSTSAQAGLIHASGAFKGGYTNISTENKTTVPETKMVNYGLDAALGLQFSLFIFGLNGEYQKFTQLTKTSEVSNVNSQGTLTAIYPLFGLEFGPLRLLGKLPTTLLKGDYTLEKKDVAGKEVTYKDPSALGIQLHLSTSPFTFWGLEYQSLKFKKKDVGGTESTLSDDKRFQLKTYALMFGLYF